MTRVANSKARALVSERRNFRGSNTYGRTLADGSYAAFSYGEHWPLFVWWRAGNTWYENAGTYSQSTRRHASQLRPYAYSPAPLPTQALIALVEICDGDVQRAANWSNRVDTYEEALQQRNRALLRLDQAAAAARLELPQPAPKPVVPDWQTPRPRRLLPLGR